MLSRFEIEQLLAVNSSIADAILLEDLEDCAAARQSEYLTTVEAPAWWRKFGFEAERGGDVYCETWSPVRRKTA